MFLSLPPHISSATRLTPRNIVLISIMILIVFASQSSAICRRLNLVHQISSAGCTPRRIPSFGCRGTCTSYSRVSPLDYRQMERHCQCCQESGHRTANVRLTCGNRYRFVQTQVPTSCMCRPCNIIGDVPDRIRLEDLNWWHRPPVNITIPVVIHTPIKDTDVKYHTGDASIEIGLVWRGNSIWIMYILSVFHKV